MDTVLVLGDQLNRRIGALALAAPGDARVLLVESAEKLASKPWHRQRAHLILASMRRFADELRRAGFEVDHRRAPSMRAGITAHVADHAPTRLVATEPNSAVAQALLDSLDVDLVRSNQFLCHRDEFAEWADGRRQRTMEPFYRQQRRRLGYLMDGDEPAGGRWNFDAENREPPPSDGRTWPTPPTGRLDALDRAVLDDLPDSCWGADPTGMWPTSRRQALARLRHVVAEVLPRFGPHEDALLSTNWHLAHTLLSAPLNLGLLLPDEVCDAAEAAYRSGDVPLASAEGFIRQVIGWREYVWGTYWLELRDDDGYRSANALGAHRPLPPVYRGAPTAMRCVASVLDDVHDHGWTHHIARLMVLGNLSLLGGVDPWSLTEWMWSGFVDGAEWVMLPNVIGMSQHADGGRMATKPYAAGGNYIDKMSDFCGDCAFDRTKRVGDDACPFTTLYWDFLDRHTERFARNPRVVQQVRAAGRRADMPEIRRRAADVLEQLSAGTL